MKIRDWLGGVASVQEGSALQDWWESKIVRNFDERRSWGKYEFRRVVLHRNLVPVSPSCVSKG